MERSRNDPPKSTLSVHPRGIDSGSVFLAEDSPVCFHRADLSKLLHVSVVLVLQFAAGIFLQPASAAEVGKPARPKIYDEAADGAKQVIEALAAAKKDNKRVLLQFGANWCGWCHKLHKLLESDAAIGEKLKADYIVVMIDVNEKHNRDVDMKYGHPVRFGLPVIVILDADGKQLTTKDSGELEEGDHHSPEKVLGFLKDWSPKR
jgi:thiol:disulfide interchange protein